MARKQLTEQERLVGASASVKPSLRRIIEALAAEKQWTFAKAAGYVMERGAEAEKLFEKYAPAEQRHAKAA